MNKTEKERTAKYEPNNNVRQLVHVSFQDPEHMMGDQGIVILNSK